MSTKFIWLLMKNNIPCSAYKSQRKLFSDVTLFYGKTFSQKLYDCFNSDFTWIDNEDSYNILFVTYYDLVDEKEDCDQSYLTKKRDHYV